MRFAPIVPRFSHDSGARNPLRGPRWKCAGSLLWLSLACSPAAAQSSVAAAPSSLATAQSTVLEAGAVVDRTIQPREQHNYTLSLAAGQSAHLEIRTEVNMVIALRRPDGAATVVIDNTGVENPPQPLTVIAHAAGAHLIEIHVVEGEEGGVYGLELGVPRLATDQDEQRVRAEALLREGLRLSRETARETRLAAAEGYRQAIDLWHGLGDRNMEAQTLHKAGWIYNRLGEARVALDTYLQDLQLFRALGNRQMEASALNNLALEHVNLGEYAEAVEPLTTSAAISHELGAKPNEGSALNNLGLAYYYTGETGKSRELYNRALQLRSSIGDRSGVAFAHAGLASLADLRGNFQEELDHASQALAIWHDLGNQQMEGLILGNLGMAHLKLGDPAVALDYLSRSETLQKRAPNRDREATTLGNIAVAYTRLGRPMKALEFANRSLDLWRELGAPARQSQAMNELAEIHVGLGQLPQALDEHTQARILARDAGNRVAEATALNGVSLVRLKQGQPGEAASAALEALSLTRERGFRVVEEQALVSLGRAEATVANLAAAQGHFEEAIKLAESIRSSVAGPDLRTSYFTGIAEEYDWLIDVTMRLHREHPLDGYDRRALEISEQGRARGLLDLLGESRLNIREGIDPALMERERVLRGAIAASQLVTGQRVVSPDDGVERLLAQYRDLQNEIRARIPRYAALTQPQPSTLHTIQHEILDDDTVLLEYALGEERSYLWVVTPSSLESYELPARATIEASSRRAYAVLSARNGVDAAGAVRALSHIVLDPVGSQLGHKRLVVVTEGALQYIPFGSLPDAAGHPLVAAHEMISLPSASTLQVLRQEFAGRTAARQSIFVLGDPVFNRHDPRVTVAGAVTTPPSSTALDRSARESGVSGLDRLWFTRQEAEGIAALAPAGEARTHLDFEASLDRVKEADLGSYRIVHFATHGLLNNRHPDLSGLVFSLVDSRGNPREGFLPAYQVYNLRLNADLVVLSACQTALGDDIRGEGLVGLTRGFMYAGAARVVASLWRVPDAATAALMRRFYRGILTDHLSPAAALRAAQTSIRAERRWSAPYYWAGFTLQGEWR
jgi:CHAT domain-containing protein/tetratricopeptide (TPR) repeat protein